MQRSLTIHKYNNKTIPKHILTDELFYQLREKVFERRPHLREIVALFGDMSLFEYAKRYNEPNSALAQTGRHKEFITAYTDEAKRLLGEEIAQSCKKQLAHIYRVTTTDHHGPLSEPSMVNTNIHEALPYLNGDEFVKNILVLGCSNVSFDNTSFPRGLLFHSSGSNGLTNQLAFYPRSVRPCPLIYFPAYTTSNLENAYQRVDEFKKENIINENEALGLKSVLNEMYADPSILSCRYFSEQVTKTNFALWKKIMKYHPQAPNLVYIEQETIVNQLLDKYHLDQNTLIHKLLFIPKYHELLLKHFDGILRGFSTKNKIGTYLFWALPQGQKYRVQLWKNGKYLQTEDGSYKIELSPQGLRNAIRNKELIPSTLFSFILLAFYYGVRLVGGKDQITYLTQMKEAFIGLLQEIEDNESIAFIKELRTTDLSLSVNSLAYLSTQQHGKIPATSIDLLLYGNASSLSIMRLLSKTLTLKEVLYRGLPAYYKRCYKEDERDPQLAGITNEDLEKYLGLENAIIPSAAIG